jgi:predicted molibdopterin-dependent oxidoreductase YjgC
VAALVEALEYSVVLASHKADWQREASVMLPVAAWSEEDGTYTNYQGRVQYAGSAIEPPGDALPVWEVFSRLLQASGVTQLWLSAFDVLSTMADSIPAFRGISVDRTRLPGVLLAE